MQTVTIKRQDYIKRQATILKSQIDKREKLSAKYLNGNLSRKQIQNLNAELNFLGMDISKTEERIAYGLGLLIPERAISEYRPSPFHTYKGIQQELENIKFL